MSYSPTNGVPGLSAERTASHRQITLGNEQYLPGLHIIDGDKTRDALNTITSELRAGLLLGRITASGKLAPSIIGVTLDAHDEDGSGNTALTVSLATATEIVRRIGASGTLKLTGPPTAAGTVAATVVTYSGVNVSTGVITITDIGADAVIGSFIAPNDGSETILTVLPNGWGMKAVDEDNVSRDLSLDRFLTAGLVDSSQILNWPSDTSLQAYIKDALRAVGNFVFDDNYGH